MKRNGRTFTQELESEAVLRVSQEGMSVAKASRDLDIHGSSLVRQAEVDEIKGGSGPWTTEGRVRTALGSICLCGLLLAGSPVIGGIAGNVLLGTGVALTPRNFPQHTPLDVSDMFLLGKEAGDFAVFIYQWSEADLHRVAEDMLQQSRQHGLTPIVAVSPTVLGGTRSEYDVPSSVRERVKGTLSFSNELVSGPFIETAIRLAKLQPPYLCLATEINFLAFKDIQEYLYFAHVYKKLYPVIKEISPDTKVFVSFQWDYFQIMDASEPDAIKEHSKLIELFRPELDLVAFTSYPAGHFSSPVEIPRDYYANVFRHLRKSDEVVFMEIGWPTRGSGSEESQRAFIQRLPELMQDVKPSVVAWSLLHDVRLPGLGEDLGSTGLLSNNGSKKVGFEAFVELARSIR